jgi:hypothetical protein
MTVTKLIEHLELADPDATVLICNERNSKLFEVEEIVSDVDICYIDVTRLSKSDRGDF